MKEFQKLLEKHELLRDDLARAIPDSFNKPQLTRTIKFKSDGELESDQEEIEIKEIIRFKSGNNIFIPIGNASPIQVVYKGFVIGPRMGHGVQEFWKVKTKKWKCIARYQTWIS